MNIRRCLALAISAVALPCLTMELRTPLELDSAATLPRGIRSPRWKAASLTVEQRYAKDSGVVPLGFRLNKTITWKEVIAAQPTADGQAQTKALIRTLGFSEADSPGQTSGDVRVSANVQIPVMAYGVTDQWTVALALPIVRASVAADSGLIRSAQAERFVAAAESASGPLKALEATQKLNDAINQKLLRMGYEPVRSFDVAGIGDLRLVQKYVVHKSDRDTLALKADLVFPTGAPPSPDRVIDLPLGDGQWDIGAGLVFDREWAANLVSSVSLGYTWQLPHRVSRRVPTAPDDLLSTNRDDDVRRKIGDQWTANSSLRYGIPAWGLSFGAGYAYQKQFRSSYEGSLYPQERYEWMSDLIAWDAEMDLHSVVLQLGFSTVDFYQTGKFAVPFQLSLAYSRPIGGSNATNNDLISGELTAFF